MNMSKIGSLLAGGALLASLAAPALAGDKPIEKTQALNHLQSQKFKVTITNVSNPIITSEGERELKLTPGVWAVHLPTAQLFQAGLPDAGMGLEAIAEMGNPNSLYSAISNAPGVVKADKFESSYYSWFPSEATPGDGYSFVVEASPGQKLSFASRVTESNDMFIAPMNGGIDLFDAYGYPMSGDVTNMVSLWDAGTEYNEIIGEGMNQGVDADDADGLITYDTIQPVSYTDQGFLFPVAPDLVKVTIEPIE